MQPYFSLILPVYNVEAYLDRCMQSILEQNFQDYEVILVDDGSTDNCPAICDGYAEKYAHVHVIHKPNGGLSSARNAGLAAACGEYIWFIDSDDWIEPDSLRTLHDSCSEKPDVVKFNHYRIDETRQKVICNVAAGCYAGEEQMKPLIEKAFRSGGKYKLSAWSHIYRQELLENTRIRFVSEREVGSEDYLFNLCLLSSIKNMLVLEEAFYNYDRREGSLTQRYRNILMLQYDRLHEFLLKNYEAVGLTDQYTGLIYRFYVWHLMIGTCVSHEYSQITAAHSILDGRRNIRRMFYSRKFRKALIKCDKKELPFKRKLQMMAMLLCFEPLFYYLYVIKPRRKQAEI